MNEKPFKVFQNTTQASPTDKIKCATCSKTFDFTSSLLKHMRTHTGEKPYKCLHDGCNHSFSQISNLIRHKRIHSGVKPYACNKCEKSFTSSSNLKQHQNTHKSQIGRNKYNCFIKSCKKGYLYVCTLKKHVKKQHFTELNLISKELKEMNFFEIYKYLEKNRNTIKFPNVEFRDDQGSNDEDEIEEEENDEESEEKVVFESTEIKKNEIENHEIPIVKEELNNTNNNLPPKQTDNFFFDNLFRDIKDKFLNSIEEIKNMIGNQQYQLNKNVNINSNQNNSFINFNNGINLISNTQPYQDNIYQNLMNQIAINQVLNPNNYNQDLLKIILQLKDVSNFNQINNLQNINPFNNLENNVILGALFNQIQQNENEKKLNYNAKTVNTQNSNLRNEPQFAVNKNKEYHYNFNPENNQKNEIKNIKNIHEKHTKHSSQKPEENTIIEKKKEETSCSGQEKPSFSSCCGSVKKNCQNKSNNPKCHEDKKIEIFKMDASHIKKFGKSQNKDSNTHCIKSIYSSEMNIEDLCQPEVSKTSENKNDENEQHLNLLQDHGFLSKQCSVTCGHYLSCPEMVPEKCNKFNSGLCDCIEICEDMKNLYKGLKNT